MFLKLRTNKFPFIITVEKFSKLIKRKQYWRNALWNVPVLLLIWWLSVFPPWFNTNQQMLVIVGHTLEKGWSEPLKYWEMALTAHKVLHKAKGDTKLHVISFIFFLLQTSDTITNTDFDNLAVLTSINTVSPCNQNSTTIFSNYIFNHMSKKLQFFYQLLP